MEHATILSAIRVHQLRLSYKHKEAILQSWDVTPTVIRCDIADKLIALGPAKDRRICKNCYHIISSNHYMYCPKCKLHLTKSKSKKVLH